MDEQRHCRLSTKHRLIEQFMFGAVVFLTDLWSWNETKCVEGENLASNKVLSRLVNGVVLNIIMIKFQLFSVILCTSLAALG